ncbi:MAG: circadian clock protein KaiC, partial [Acetobacteraceae bacterium]|nr:circadian clock protein KaiC [Acetobacteraceae bacterium]
MKKPDRPAKSKLPEAAGSNTAIVKINKLSTGVAGFDDILGGGIPEFAMCVVGGPPGGGKTTLAHQVAFANGTPQRPALYFTVLGEPVIKMLRYQQQFSFFDVAKLNNAVRFVSLSDVVLDQDLNAVLGEIVKQVTASNAGVVVVDSFRTLARKAISDEGDAKVQSFVHRLSQFMSASEVTTLLIGEYFEEEIRDNSLFTIVDGI